MSVIEYKRARIKFNNGYGALLCNGCASVVWTGFGHEDVEHYCGEACRPKPAPSVVEPDDDYGLFYG